MTVQTATLIINVKVIFHLLTSSYKKIQNLQKHRKPGFLLLCKTSAREERTCLLLDICGFTVKHCFHLKYRKEETKVY